MESLPLDAEIIQYIRDHRDGVVVHVPMIPQPMSGTAYLSIPPYRAGDKVSIQPEDTQDTIILTVEEIRWKRISDVKDRYYLKIWQRAYYKPVYVDCGIPYYIRFVAERSGKSPIEKIDGVSLFTVYNAVVWEISTKVEVVNAL